MRLGDLKNYRHCKRLGDCNEQPVFKVRCQLVKQEVSLPTGYKATLKKGMSLRARFMVAKRSLFQLLYDKVDDWVNPNLNQIN
jgi:membrane fusion protein, peptide pheromone/bacteriocin exporter